MPFEKDKKTGYLTPKGGYSIQGFTAEAKVKWLEVYKEHGNIGRACKDVGIHRDTFYEHLQKDEKFLADFKTSRLDHESDLEADMLQRGKRGSAIHAFGWLKANFPNKWREKTIIQHKADDRSVIDLTNKSGIYEADDSTLPSEGSKPN